MTDNKYHMAMLFDFYGDMLTQKQKEYFDLYHNEDLSLSEIAAGAGISRQGVHDIINRAEKTLEGFESKTGVVARWSDTRRELENAKKLAAKLAGLTDSIPQAKELSEKLIESLTALTDK